MKTIKFVSELPAENLKDLKAQLYNSGFNSCEVNGFVDEKIVNVEDTLKLTTYYLTRDENNKPVTIVNNRTTKETEYLVVEYFDGRIDLYDDVTFSTTNDTMNSTKELLIRVWWGGEDYVNAYIALKDIKDFYYINNPDHIKQ